MKGVKWRKKESTEIYYPKGVYIIMKKEEKTLRERYEEYIRENIEKLEELPFEDIKDLYTYIKTFFEA